MNKNKNKNKKLTCWDYEKKAVKALKNQVIPLLGKAIGAANSEPAEGDASTVYTIIWYMTEIIENLSAGDVTISDYFYDTIRDLFWEPEDDYTEPIK